MISKKYFLVGVSLMLTSCTVNLDRQGRNEPWRMEGWQPSRQAPDYINERGISRCPVYSLPEARPLPPVPAEQLRKLGRNDHDAREVLYLDYIQALREHIKDTKSDNTDQFLKYLQLCTSTKSK